MVLKAGRFCIHLTLPVIVIGERCPLCNDQIEMKLGCALTSTQVRRPGEMLEFEVWDGRLIRQFQVGSTFHLPCM